MVNPALSPNFLQSLGHILLVLLTRLMKLNGRFVISKPALAVIAELACIGFPVFSPVIDVAIMTRINSQVLQWEKLSQLSKTH